MLVTTETVSSFGQHPCCVQKVKSHSSPPHPSPLTNFLAPLLQSFLSLGGGSWYSCPYQWLSTQSLILRTLNSYKIALTITYGSKEPPPYIIISSLSMKLTLNSILIIWKFLTLIQCMSILPIHHYLSPTPPSAFGSPPSHLHALLLLLLNGVSAGHMLIDWGASVHSRLILSSPCWLGPGFTWVCKIKHQTQNTAPAEAMLISLILFVLPPQPYSCSSHGNFKRGETFFFQVH